MAPFHTCFALYGGLCSLFYHIFTDIAIIYFKYFLSLRFCFVIFVSFFSLLIIVSLDFVFFFIFIILLFLSCAFFRLIFIFIFVCYIVFTCLRGSILHHLF